MTEKIKVFLLLLPAFLSTYGLQQLILVSALIAVMFIGSIAYLFFSGSAEIITAYTVAVAIGSTALAVAATILHRYLNPPLPKSVQK